MPKKLPKPLASLKERVLNNNPGKKGAAGGEVTLQHFGGLNREDLKNSYNALTSEVGKLGKQALDAFKAIKGNEEKKKMMAAYMNDPDQGLSKSMNGVIKRHVERETEDECWLHQSELEGPMYFNSLENVQLMIKRQGFEVQNF